MYLLLLRSLVFRRLIPQLFTFTFHVRLVRSWKTRSAVFPKKKPHWTALTNRKETEKQMVKKNDREQSYARTYLFTSERRFIRYCLAALFRTSVFPSTRFAYAIHPAVLLNDSASIWDRERLSEKRAHIAPRALRSNGRRSCGLFFSSRVERFARALHFTASRAHFRVSHSIWRIFV